MSKPKQTTLDDVLARWSTLEAKRFRAQAVGEVLHVDELQELDELAAQLRRGEGGPLEAPAEIHFVRADQLRIRPTAKLGPGARDVDDAAAQGSAP